MQRLRRSKAYIAVVITVLFLASLAAHAQVAFVKNFDEALKQAAKEKKFVVLDISASW